MSQRTEIQQIALAKKVPFLAHFTRTDNIPSIMTNGLLPVSIAVERDIAPVINDDKRLDGRLNGTSLSISFPNGPMFYRLRNEHPEVGWAILAISPSVLWSKTVLFCCHNAADTRVSRVASDMLCQPAAFSAMFDEIEGHETRAEQGLRECDPTDVQAEVLVMEEIEPEFIIGALFNDGETREKFSPYFGKRKLIVHRGKKGLFANRTYYRKFGGG